MSQTIRFDNGDIEIDSTGGQTWISGAEKAAQDLLHEITLPYDVRSDRGNELFGPDGSLAQITASDSVGPQVIRTYIRSAVNRLMRAQQQDARTDRSELIQAVKNLVVQRLGNDVTSYGFYLSVVVDDENIAVAREIGLAHLGDVNRPVVGGYDP